VKNETRMECFWKNEQNFKHQHSAMLNSRTLRKIQCTQRSMERCMLGITRRHRKRNTWVRCMGEKVEVAGRIARRIDGRWTREILEWYSRGCERKQGRPSDKWANELSRMCASQINRDSQEWKGPSSSTSG
jgi:hypothetical protein